MYRGVGKGIGNVIHENKYRKTINQMTHFILNKNHIFFNRWNILYDK